MKKSIPRFENLICINKLERLFYLDIFFQELRAFFASGKWLIWTFFSQENNFMLLFRGGYFNPILKVTLKIYLEKVRRKGRTLQANLKSDSHLSKDKIIYFNKSHFKTRKNAFYFIWKRPFILKLFKLLSWFFGHVENAASLER